MRFLCIVGVIVLVTAGVAALSMRSPAPTSAAPISTPAPASEPTPAVAANAASAAGSAPISAPPTAVPVAPADPTPANPTSAAPTPQVAALLAARDGSHPERRSLLNPPAPFDLAAFTADPEPYLAVAEPGRVFQSAEPGPEVPDIVPQPMALRSLATGETQTLAVQVQPGAPVSWYCLEGGIFTESDLNAITVRANADGVAQVTYLATPGTSGDALVLAASPLHQGQAKFFLHVTEGK